MINRTDSIIRDRLSKGKERGFLIFHPSLTYFARRYGLQQIAIEHEGKEPSVSHMCHVIDEAMASGIEKVLIRSQRRCNQSQSFRTSASLRKRFSSFKFTIPATLLVSSVFSHYISILLIVSRETISFLFYKIVHI